MSTAPTPAYREARANLTLGIAMLTIVDHIRVHSIAFPDEFVTTHDGGHPGLTLYIRPRDEHAWTSTVHIDKTVDRKSVNPGKIRTTWTVRLPDSGTVVTLVTTREQPFGDATDVATFCQVRS